MTPPLRAADWPAGHKKGHRPGAFVRPGAAQGQDDGIQYPGLKVT
jgi:hypothetical protein